MTNVTALLTQLVAFDTTSSESNLALIEFVERYLADYGVTAERVMSPCGTPVSRAKIGGWAKTAKELAAERKEKKSMVNQPRR